VTNGSLSGADVVEGHDDGAGRLVHQRGVALRERAALAILLSIKIKRQK
jgi:hypothetical protein